MLAVKDYRKIITQRLCNQTNTFIAIVGPCSIYCEEETYLFEEQLKALQEELGDSIFLVMRAFVEKSRTAHNWRGFVYKPPPLSHENILEGISRSQKLFGNCNMPLAMEAIDPQIFPHLEKYLSWGFIGARTCTSTTHRILASSTSLPFGFKNPLDGNVEHAINGALVANHSHCSLQGNTQSYTKGNPNTHIVLRGGSDGTNFDTKHTNLAYKLSTEKGLSTPLLIDCSHGNCPIKPHGQKKAFESSLNQYLENPKKIIGVMLESNLKEGAIKHEKIPGISYTDPCLSFQETKKMLLLARDKIIEHRKEESVLSTSYEYSH